MQSLFRERLAVVDSMREHGEAGTVRYTLHVEPISLPIPGLRIACERCELLHLSHRVFAPKLGADPSIPECWERSRSKDHEQAATRIPFLQRPLGRLGTLGAQVHS